MDRGVATFVRRLTRQRRPLGATYWGLVMLTALGGIGGSLFSAMLFLSRPLGEPLLILLLSFLSRGTRTNYNPDYYIFYIWLVVGITLLWMILLAWTIIRKPAQDRHMDETLRRRLRPHARGAPLDPP